MAVLDCFANLLALAAYGVIMLLFGRVWEIKAQETRALRESLLPSLNEDDGVEPEPITARNPNAALAALAMRWDQESWAPPAGPLNSDEERSYHFLEVER